MKKPRCTASRVLATVLKAGALCLVLGAALVLRGCMNAHSRPVGHGDLSFAISPRDEVVFNAVGEGGRDLYRLDLMTFRVNRIAATSDYEVDPNLSPDGKTVVYTPGKPGDRADHIFVRSLDGQTVKQLNWKPGPPTPKTNLGLDAKPDP